MSETRKVCLLAVEGRWVNEVSGLCGRGIRSPHRGLLAREWPLLPRQAQCDDCAYAATKRPVFDTDDRRRIRETLESIGHSSATDLQILSVSIFCASLFGVRDETFRAFSLEHLETANVDPLLDYLEGIGAHRPEFRWPAQEPREWRVVEQHRHAWLAWRSGDEERGASDFSAVPRRCTCGVFEHEHAQLRASGLSEEGACHLEMLRRRYLGYAIQTPPVFDPDPNDRDIDIEVRFPHHVVIDPV